MRNFQSLLFKNLDDSIKINNLPAFPKKRMFNTLDPVFLNDRMTQLGHFFNTVLSNPEIAKSNLVLTYFVAQKLDDQN